MFEVWSKGEFRKYRALLYIASGAFAIIPVSFFLIKNGLGHLPSVSENPAFVWMGMMIAMYLIGAYFYVNQIPERYWAGRFDLFGHSHQIWHLFPLQRHRGDDYLET
ncbi:hypothetical protein HDV01_000124 [Terramyces sp. JEL0728]|nr:hypothetical protein HDV01_000124 [Terramyces sp. JEL0728]